MKSRDLADKITEAFEIADTLQQGGNPRMQQVKLELKKAAAHFDPALTADLSGRLTGGGGSRSAQPAGDAPAVGGSRFAWKEGNKSGHRGSTRPLGKKVGEEKPAVPADEPKQANVPKGTETTVPDTSLYEKLSSLTPAAIVSEYGEMLQGIGDALKVSSDELWASWSNTQKAAAIKRAAKAKLTPQQHERI